MMKITFRKLDSFITKFGEKKLQLVPSKINRLLSRRRSFIAACRIIGVLRDEIADTFSFYVEVPVHIYPSAGKTLGQSSYSSRHDRYRFGNTIRASECERDLVN